MLAPTGLLEAADLVRREVIHDNHAAGDERRRQELLDIGAESDTGDGPVEDERSGQAGPTQGPRMAADSSSGSGRSRRRSRQRLPEPSQQSSVLADCDYAVSGIETLK
jgi:hypothetical protein